MRTITVYEPDDKVLVNGKESRVLTVQIGMRDVYYEIGYWLNGDWKQTWLPQSEISAIEEPTMKIGFKQ